MKTELKHEDLKRQLKYNRLTGDWFWLSIEGYNPRKVGDKAGCIITTGRPKKPFRVITVNDTRLRSSHLAFFYVNGYWSENVIIHRNGDTTDDRWRNLEEVPHKLYHKFHKAFGLAGYKK